MGWHLTLRPNIFPQVLPKNRPLVTGIVCKTAELDCYLLDGAQAGIAGHGEV